MPTVRADARRMLKLAIGDCDKVTQHMANLHLTYDAGGEHEWAERFRVVAEAQEVVKQTIEACLREL
jgi:hypothetical protein